MAIVHEYEAELHAFHELTPVPLAHTTPESTAAMIEDLEEGAQAEMPRLDSQCPGMAHQTMIIPGEPVWSAVEEILT
jgi:hypothetical protein